MPESKAHRIKTIQHAPRSFLAVTRYIVETDYGHDEKSGDEDESKGSPPFGGFERFATTGPL